MALSLDEPLTGLVGPATAKALAKGLDIYTAEDLLRHYPRRYAKRGELTDLGTLRPDEQVTVVARVSDVDMRPMRNRPGWMLEVTVTDDRHKLLLTFFGKTRHRVEWRLRDLAPGRTGLFAGKVSEYGRRRQLTHPDYQILPWSGAVDDAAKVFANELIPVYKTTGKVQSWQIAKAIGVLLDQLGWVPDPIPVSVRQRRGLMEAHAALRAIHQPQTEDEVRSARHRLKYEEAFVLQAELARRRASVEALLATPRQGRPDGIRERFDAQLPFELTSAQRSVDEEISADLARTHPMHRLLQGEVGSGKTVVALRAMLQVIDSGGQTALLAPTEVLAHQHYRSLTQLLGPLAEVGMLGGSDVGTRVVLLTGSMNAAARRTALLAAASGEAGIVVGTHALLEEQVQFADLGLVVVDEQHRFGVEQRAALAGKSPDSTRPHVLVMTATPIPRTVAMTVFGDLSVSTMSELPSGRADVATHVIPVAEKPRYLERAWQRVREEVAAGNQVYIVCPRIGDESDTDAENDHAADDAPDGGGTATEEAAQSGRRPVAVLELVEMLRTGPLAGIDLQILHGRLPAEAKDETMRRFSAGEIPVLVATTVIEVGVDVPTASTMIVMDASRFGVSQLHQLRGRIGRSNIPGLCLLVTDAPLDSEARERLEAVAATRDGFKLAQIDLEQRREGDVLGAAQSGRKSSLRLLRALRDENLIMIAREDATSVLIGDPELRDHPALAEAMAGLSAGDRADYLEKA